MLCCIVRGSLIVNEFIMRVRCDLLAANDHPFIMQLVKTFETAEIVYILTELITGGELHAAIRTIPTVLSRAQVTSSAQARCYLLWSLCTTGTSFLSGSEARERYARCSGRHSILERFSWVCLVLVPDQRAISNLLTLALLRNSIR